MPRRLHRPRRRSQELEIEDINELARNATDDCAAADILKARLAARKTSQQLPTNATDFIVTCGDYTWTFHKEVFEEKSEYFQVMNRSAFREARQGVIDLSEEDPQLLVRLFQYIYTNKYALLNDDEVVPGFSVDIGCERGWKGSKEDFKRPAWDETWCMLHLNMYAMGDYFIMPTLQEFALGELRYAVQMTISLAPVAECIEALDEWGDSSLEQVNRIVASLKQGLGRRDQVNWTSAQTAKIRELAEKFPALKELI